MKILSMLLGATSILIGIVYWAWMIGEVMAIF